MSKDGSSCTRGLKCDGCGLPQRLSSETGELLPLQRCSRCQQVYYHDRDCQRNHYKDHRKQCRKHTPSSSTTTSPQALDPSPFQCRQAKAGQWLQIAKSEATFKASDGTSVSFSLGTPCQVEEILEGGSLLLLCFKNETSVECRDFSVVESLTPIDVHKQNEDAWDSAFRLWMEGVKLWYNHQAYLDAMDVWDQSMNCFTWRDSHNFSPLRGNAPRRIELARRLIFLSFCRLDADAIQKGRQCLMRALRTIPNSETSVSSIAFAELMMSYEEERNMKMARTVAGWAVEHRCCCWKDENQRPGFMFPLEGREKQLPYYPRELIPSWCKVLEDHWEVIRSEYLDLIRSSSRGESDLPHHWPKVGSGERGSGQDDHKVVSGGGDWREWVLFGAGASPSHTAKKTKAILRRHVPDAVTLAEAGGGEVIFSVLAPRTKIQPHCASTNLRLTAHLGLVVPVGDGLEPNINPGGMADCRIRVREKWHTWTEGKMLVFDDSYEHEVVNNTNECRAVLLIRFWHPAIPLESRIHKLEEALRRKVEDVRRRYNPPLPQRYEAAEQRGMELNACRSCLQNGYNSLSLVGDISGSIAFECTCGEPII